MLSEFRYEMKYEIEHKFAHAISAIIKLHPSGFKKAFPDRWINNIYFDTPEFVTCQENLDGISNRKKFRVRWYGDAQKIVNPKLEIKIKDNNLGQKLTLAIGTEDIKGIYSFIKHQSFTPDALIPVIKNRYVRSYFINAQGNFRLTVDRHISNGRVDFLDRPLSAHMLNMSKVIVEIKFNTEHLPQHKEITRYLPFRQTKHSKYLTAVLATLAYA